MTDVSAPLTPADCDLSDFDRMPLDIKRLGGSKFDAGLDDSAWRAGLNLWMSAWHARPAGSLDDDEEALCTAAGLRDLKKWAKVRAKAMREHWVRCSDGRLYHKTLCELALESWLEKLGQRKSSGAGNAKRWGARFDPDQVQADIDIACEHLERLNSDSKALAKARRKHGKRNPDGNEKPPGGKSQRDENPQGEKSQENGMERRGLEEPSPPPPVPSGPASANAGGGPSADDAPTPNWAERVSALHVELKGLLDPTSPGTQNASVLRKLCEREGIGWPDVRDAVVAVVKTHGSTSKPIRSFGYPPIIDTAHANHQRSTNPENRNGHANGAQQRGSSSPGPKLGGLRRAALQDQARRDAESGERADDAEGVRAPT